MTEFLVEVYLARGGGGALERRSAQARTAAEELTSEGTPAEDETCFFLYEAESAEAVRTAARRAGFGCGRITEAFGAQEGDEACL